MEENYIVLNKWDIEDLIGTCMTSTMMRLSSERLCWMRILRVALLTTRSVRLTLVRLQNTINLHGVPPEIVF